MLSPWSISCDLPSTTTGKVEKILKGSLDLIPSPSPSVKIQIMGGKVCLRCKGKTLLGVVNKLLITKSLLTSPNNVLPLHLKQTFRPIIWIFTEGDGMKPRLPFRIFPTLRLWPSEPRVHYKYWFFFHEMCVICFDLARSKHTTNILNDI